MIKYYCLFLLLSLSTQLRSQFGSPDIELLRNVGKVDIPFEYVNNFIIVKVIFNDLFPLRFIFDTGAENTILTQRMITDLLQINYQRRYVILGSDMSTEMYAYLATGLRLRIGDMVAFNRSVLVLEEDYFRFEEYAGVNVQGILGADFLRRFVVRINYRRKIITLYDPNRFGGPGNRFVQIPAEFNRYKPYIFANTAMSATGERRFKYLLDTGASLALLMHLNTDSTLQMPERVVQTNIGMGLGGYLEGFVGRVHHIGVGSDRMENVVASFQNISEDADSSLLNGRNGIIGNDILDRFEIIVDYVHEKLYLASTHRVKERFKFDRSGLSLAASGPNLRTFVVMSVTPNSPAAEAGLLPGDEIRTVNGLPVSLLDLSSIVAKFRGRVGKNIRLRVKRGEEMMKVRFELRELI